MEGQEVTEVLTSSWFWIKLAIIMLGTGTLIWLVRQVLPVHLEKKKYWKKILKVAPVPLGALVAIIPGVQLFPENLAVCAIIGFIAGSFSQTAYDSVRDFVPEKIKSLLGSRAKRVHSEEFEDDLLIDDEVEPL